MVSGRTGLGEGGLLVNGDGRKDGGIGDRCKFANFDPPGMEGNLRRGGRLSLQVSCGGGRVCRSGLVNGSVMYSLYCYLGRLLSSDLFFCFLGVGGWFCNSANCEDAFFK